MAKQGLRFVVLGLVMDLVGSAMTVGAVMGHRAQALGAGIGLLVLATAFTAFCIYFFRDPERPLPTDPKKIYSPGDGRVMSVGREGPGDIVTLRIFLSVFDVHIQRAPCAGKVENVQHIKGSFAAAMKDEAKGNERCVMTLTPEGGRERLVVEQIAGLIARRIECWPVEGESLKSGERYGIIYFGSQAAVHFPASARCTVKPGDRVAGALSEIGEWLPS
jgi:phosphatidylserine decarboxylase